MDTLKESEATVNEKEKALILKIEFKPDKSTMEKVINAFNYFLPDYAIKEDCK